MSDPLSFFGLDPATYVDPMKQSSDEYGERIRAFLKHWMQTHSAEDPLPPIVINIESSVLKSSSDPKKNTLNPKQ